MGKITSIYTLVGAWEVKIGDSIRLLGDEVDEFSTVTSICHDGGLYSFDTDNDYSTHPMDRDSTVEIQRGPGSADVVTLWWDRNAWIKEQTGHAMRETDLEDLLEALVHLLCVPAIRKMLRRERSFEGAWLWDILDTLSGHVSSEVYRVLTSRQIELGPRNLSTLEADGWLIDE